MTNDNDFHELNEATRDATKALIKAFKQNISRVPNRPNGKRVFVHMVKDIDFYEQEIPVTNSLNGKERRSQVPAIIMSLPGLSFSDGVFYDQRSFVKDGTEDSELTHGFVGESSLFLDHTYLIKLVADHTVTLQVLMRMFANMFRSKTYDLEIYDKLNDKTYCNEVCVEEWPNGNFSTGINQGLFDAMATIKIKGVEYTSDKFERYPLIKDYCVVGVGMDDKVTTKVSNGEIIIKIS